MKVEGLSYTTRQRKYNKKTGHFASGQLCIDHELTRVTIWVVRLIS